MRFCQVDYPGRQRALASLTFFVNWFAFSKAKSVNVDVTGFLSVKQLVNKTVERSGRLDYMFNNAGIASGTKLN
jgi:NAD(P)-dependent dehydrogenase (short-subunit alcohol dehydrogenase family)